MDAPANIVLQQGEVARHVVRRHPWFLASRLILVAIIFFLFWIVLDWINDIINGAPISVFTGDWLWIWLIGALISALIALSVWYRYHHSTWIITDRRLIDSDQSNPLNRHTTSAELNNIMTMNMQQRGIAASMFRYGDVLVETPASSGAMALRGVAQPQEVLNMISQARDEARARAAAAAPRVL
jgi:phosphotransferase system  glucose/maltose/N-acetylglucosamine-specific IIC component